MFLCLQNLTLLVEHAGLLGHSAGVLVGLLSSKTRYQALFVDSRFKPKADQRSKRSEENRPFTEPKTKPKPEPKQSHAV